MTFVFFKNVKPRQLKIQPNSPFLIIFFTRKSRSSANQLSIFFRITVTGQRSEISLKRTVLIREWDSSKNRGRGSTYKVRVLNSYLDQVYSQLVNCHKQLEESKIITANALTWRYLGEEDNDKSLKELISLPQYQYAQRFKTRYDEKLYYYGKVFG